MHLLVAMAVAGQLVALGNDAADQGRVPLGHPAQGEEGGAHVGGGEEVEHAMGVRLHASLARVPAVARDGAGEGLDLEPVLDIDGHGVAKAGCMGGLQGSANAPSASAGGAACARVPRYRAFQLGPGDRARVRNAARPPGRRRRGLGADRAEILLQLLVR